MGDELLRGFTVDTNSNWLAGRLFSLGYPLKRIEVVGDVEADIVAAVQDHMARPELVRIFVCGGLGPTPDDRTFQALARALDRPLVYDQATGAAMQNLMFSRGLAKLRGTAELNAGNRKMAMVPEGSVILRNGPGMAPGVAYPLGSERFLFAMPGVPPELRSLFRDWIEPGYLRDGSAPAVGELHYHLAPESAFAEAMLALESEYPEVSLGSYPQTELGRLIIRASGSDSARVQQVLDEIRRRVGRYQPLA
ncbi:MAG TPA: molybdopterin-binding protein [Candidatus Limnocylindria bacterium]|nr:molybdopterin-binding protein [Candidatus Limnocylindria bacterium]